MNKDFIIEREGKQFVLYAGLLDLAHQQGLKGITTMVLQLPTSENEGVALCHATVETAKGKFSGLGDASPKNVSRLMVPHLIRMAETRAKARALRDAVNFGVTAFEELGEGEVEPSAAPAPPRKPATPTGVQERFARAQRAPAPAGAASAPSVGPVEDVGEPPEDEYGPPDEDALPVLPAVEHDGEPATEEQVGRIGKEAGRLNWTAAYVKALIHKNFAPKQMRAELTRGEARRLLAHMVGHKTAREAMPSDAP